MSGKAVKSVKLRSNMMTVGIIAALLCFTVFITLVGNLSFSSSLPSQDGTTFDLAGIDFDSGESVLLAGNWNEYAGKFIVTDEIENPNVSAVVDVPGSVGDALVTDGTASYDAASYECKIKNLTAEQLLTLYIPNISGAYRVFVNGMLVSYNGEPDKDADKAWSTSTHNDLPFVIDGNGEFTVVVELSSKSNMGMYMPVKLANYEAVRSADIFSTALRFLTCGIVFSCAVIFIILKYIVHKELYSLWLPVLSFVLLYRLFMSGSGYAVIQSFMFDISYEKIATLTFVLTFVIKLVSFIYIAKCVKLDVQDNVYVAFSAVFLVLALGVNFFPDSVFNSYYYLVLQFISVIIDIYIFNRLSIEICKKTEYALLYLLSYVFIVVGVLADVLYENGIIHANLSFFMPMCFLLFVLFTAIIHALRVRKLFGYALQAQKFQSELERANFSMMLSQIQPHFMYNALNTIKSLVKREPDKAEKAVIDFSMYLRGNMDALSQVDPIPFKEELAHVKHYCNIEQLRFGDKLDIFYEIGPDEFYVPVLSVQPIVENAIKHGVTKKAEGGSVTIITEEDNDNYYLIIEDDGVGFDVEKAMNIKDDTRSHVGIKSIKERFENIMSAKVTIDSTVNKGSKVTVTLPKNKNFKTLQESIEAQKKTSALEELKI